MLPIREYICDLAIIGGGINGAAIARDASLRGLQVVLIEKEDFGNGASTKTSKLVHGGLRYLKNYQFGLVKNSLEERAILLQIAPHLVQLLPFVYPHYVEDNVALWQKKLGLFVYGLLGSDRPKKHESVTSEEILKMFPSLKQENLAGGMLYYDAEMLDNRIIIENLLSASDQNAIILNYTEATDLVKEGEKVVGVSYRSKNGDEGLIHAKKVVNATGAWCKTILNMDNFSSTIQITPSKGIHIVFPEIFTEKALILNTPQDNRVFFVIPWNGCTLVGTTDTPYNDNPELLQVNDEEIDYLLKAFQYYFPDMNVTRNSIISTFVGLRPLLTSNTSDTYSATRDYTIETSPSGLITLVGGKYTTHRKMAQDVVDLVVQQFENQNYSPCRTHLRPLYGAENYYLKNASDERLEQIAQEYNLSTTQLARLMETYGKGSMTILEIIKSSPQEGLPICGSHPHIYAEITYAIKFEKACTLEDWFFRRTLIGYTDCRGLHCLSNTAKKFAEILGWDFDKIEVEKNNYLNSLALPLLVN